MDDAIEVAVPIVAVDHQRHGPVDGRGQPDAERLVDRSSRHPGRDLRQRVLHQTCWAALYVPYTACRRVLISPTVA